MPGPIGTQSGAILFQEFLLGAGSAADQTLSADLTLVDKDQAIQYVNCNGANRTCNLPTPSIANHQFVIVNVTPATYTLTVKSGSTTLAVLTAAGGSMFVISDGTTWYAVAAPAVSSFAKIAEVVLSATQATLDFQNIPATYSSLMLIGLLRVNNADASAFYYMRFNNDSGGNYTSYSEHIRGDGSIINSTSVAGTQALLGHGGGGNYIANGNTTAGYFDAITINIPYYRQTVTDKAYNSHIGAVHSTATELGVLLAGGLWASTVAINRITILLNGANVFAVGTSLALYGIG